MNEIFEIVTVSQYESTSDEVSFLLFYIRPCVFQHWKSHVDIPCIKKIRQKSYVPYFI